MKPVHRSLVVLAGALALGACQTGEAAEEGRPRLLTAQVTRGDLLLSAEATGTVEPVRTVEVKSMASGAILRLHADIGDFVRSGTLLAEIDPRDVRNRYNQTEADLAVAQAQLEIARAQYDRQQALLEAEVITQSEFENARLSFANAEASLVRAQTNFELAELQLADVNIRAPFDGTIIVKNVEEGSVIQSAASNVSGGAALFIMANLADMQVRTLVDETDMGDLESGLEATVRVEAFPDRTFRGVVDKIEPQATVEQNVTMFPVIVSLDNRAGLLKPGMNAEVEISIDQALDVVIAPNNAIVQIADIGPAALALGLSVDDIDMSQFVGAGRGGFGGGGRGGPGGRTGTAPGQGAAGGPEGAEAGREGATAGRPGATEGGDPAAGATPAMQRIQELRAQARSGAITQDSLRNAMAALRQSGQAVGFRPGAGNGDAAPMRETRPAGVFVLGPDSIPTPRLVQIGIGDWDNTQIVSGLEAGETLVIVGAAQLQAQQQEWLNNMRSRAGGSPFGGGGPGGPRGR